MTQAGGGFNPRGPARDGVTTGGGGRLRRASRFKRAAASADAAAATSPAWTARQTCPARRPAWSRARPAWCGSTAGGPGRTPGPSPPPSIPSSTAVRSAGPAEQPVGFLDLRLRDGLDPAGRHTQQKPVSVPAPGGGYVLADVAGGRFESYDSLAKAYALYATLSKDPGLAESAFVPAWPTLTDAERRVLHSTFAVHEPHVFLARKDPAFFAAEVRPYLANKKDKTFVDHWLLGDDLGRFRDPWRYDRLNTAERVPLARRVAGEPARTARHLDDLLRLQPPDVGRDLFLFDTAVQSGDMDGEGEGDFNKAEGQLKLSVTGGTFNGGAADLPGLAFEPLAAATPPQAEKAKPADPTPNGSVGKESTRRKRNSPRRRTAGRTNGGRAATTRRGTGGWACNTNPACPRAGSISSSASGPRRRSARCTAS